MNLLATFNENPIEPTDYADRETVKAIIINDNDEVLLFGSGLPGGGVEEGETLEEALHRELMEEIGATIEIIRELGNVITYRDVLRKKYIFTGYYCQLVSLARPTTTFENEIGVRLSWKNREQTIRDMENHILEVQTKGKEVFEGDRYQAHLFNTKTAIVFLKALDM